MQPYPPLGSLYAAAELRRRGHEVALFDAMLAESESEWDDALQRHRPDVAVIFEDNFNYLSKMCLLRMRTAAFRMLQMAKRRGCTTVVCGSDATDNEARYLEQGADFVVVGEGEVTLAALLDQELGTPVGQPRRVRGLAFRDPAGETVSTGSPREPEGPGHAGLPGVGPRRRRPLPAGVEPARPLLHEHGHDARVPVPLQLVRQADLGPALRVAEPRQRRRRAGMAPCDIRARTTSPSPTTSSG